MACAYLDDDNAELRTVGSARPSVVRDANVQARGEAKAMSSSPESFPPAGPPGQPRD